MAGWDGDGVVMMRSQGLGDEIRASAYQYHPRYLLFRTDSDWHAGSLLGVHRRMMELAPPDARPGLSAIWHGQSRQDEANSILAARWIEQCGEAHGFRTPQPEERARATGRGAYLTALGLTRRQLYDLVGDHFDPDAVLLRIAAPIRGWLHGGCLPAPAPAQGPWALLSTCARLRQQVIQGGFSAEAGPFPSDLRNPLFTADATSSAAQGGRGAQ